jgi:hypothetical protein
VNIYNPGTLLSSVIDTTLTSGTYYLKVEGKGNVYAPNYASLGSYSLQGSFTAGAPLPLRRLELRGSVNQDKHNLNWIIDADEQVVKLVIEVSTNGLNFTSLSQPVNNNRSYSYATTVTTPLMYRLNVTFDNGRQYYSNIVTLKTGNITPRPKLLGNLIANNITVSSPGNYTYSILDMNGRAISKGNLTNGTNTISASNMFNGMYIIRFEDGRNQWIEKMIRQ